MSDKVSIVTANYRPLRFVQRDGLDTWSPTLNQINERDYDYVKLHRVSTYLDVGIAPYSMGVCFDGTLILPALPQYQERMVALSLFNKTLAEIFIGGIYCEAVAPNDISYGTLSLTGYTKLSEVGEGDSVALHSAARCKHIGTLDVIKLLSPEMVDVKEVTQAMMVGRELLSKLGEIPLEQVLYGTTFYVRKQWAESLIHIWTVTERIVELAWDRYVVSSHLNPSKSRRAFLDDHRSWPVSVKLEMLYQKELLSADVLENLDFVRKARNEFAHKAISPSYDVATRAIISCFQLASLCSSGFKDDTLFGKVVDLLITRCNPTLYPKKTRYEEKEVSHWLPMPAVPGDKEWGDKPYEIFEDIVIQPLQNERE